MMPEKIMNQIWEKKYAFLGTFFLVFFISYLILVAIDFVPEAAPSDLKATEATDEVSDETAPMDDGLPTGFSNQQILPTALYIKKLDRTIEVLNPTSRTVADLDTALLSGAVRHPDSATMSQDGNIFILGHSSYLPTVFNNNFKAFNGIQDLAWGDTIEVRSDSYVSIYQVEKVYKAKAEDVTVPIAGTGPQLTLATCNSFGSTDDRFVVEAKRIEVRAL